MGSSINGTLHHHHHHHHLHNQQQQTANGSNNCGEKDLINARLSEVITIYQEVDRAARKLEQLTEQRRERLREMTRQRALDDEINEVMLMMRVRCLIFHGSISLSVNVSTANLQKCGVFASTRTL